MKPTLLHRLTSLVLVAALLGSTYPAPLLAQQAVSPEPAPIVTDRPLSPPPAGPQPEARLLREQEQMLARLAATDAGALPVAAEPPKQQVQLPELPKFSEPPTDGEIEMVQLFDQAAIPFGVEKPGENAAFARAIGEWAGTPRQRRNLAVFESFLRDYPGSRWEVAIQRHIARLHARDGFFSRTLTATERAWGAARAAKESPQREIADGLAADLAELCAQLGRRAELSALVLATREREMSLQIADRIQHARLSYGPDVVRGRGGSGNCGASALAHMLAALRPNAPEPKIFSDSAQRIRLGFMPGPDGYSLRELAALADAAGVPMRAVQRQAVASAAGRPAGKEADWPVPCVIHWSRGHYSALVQRSGSQYLLRDRSLGGDRYVTAEALREEASGFALMEDKPLP